MTWRVRRRSLLRYLITSCVLSAMVAFNLWWYWRDTRPLPDLTTISRWIRQEQFARAETSLREHLRRLPHDAAARTALARVLAARGDLLGCARQLHQVPFWSPEKAEALYREGQSYLQINRAKDAETAWLELLKEDPLHPLDQGLREDAALALLELYATEDRWDDGYAVIWSSYDHAAPADQTTWLSMRMRSELERISPKVSIERLRRYAAAAPDDWEAIRALALAELALGLRTAAEHHLKLCVHARPDDVRAWRDYLAMLLEQGDLKTFLTMLKQPPAAAENEPETWFFRGVATEKAANWIATADHFHKALELNPYVSKYHYRLAMAQERLGLREQALEHRNRTRQINEARAQLRGAFNDYVSVAEQPRRPGTPDPVSAAKHLASICETLGWLRAAQAWNQVVRMHQAG